MKLLTIRGDNTAVDGQMLHKGGFLCCHWDNFKHTVVPTLALLFQHQQEEMAELLRGAEQEDAYGARSSKLIDWKS